MNLLNINKERLLLKLKTFGKIGGLENGDVTRLALTDENKKGRDAVVFWMKELGLEVKID